MDLIKVSIKKVPHMSAKGIRSEYRMGSAPELPPKEALELVKAGVADFLDPSLQADYETGKLEQLASFQPAKNAAKPKPVPAAPEKPSQEVLTEREDAKAVAKKTSEGASKGTVSRKRK